MSYTYHHHHHLRLLMMMMIIVVVITSAQHITGSDNSASANDDTDAGPVFQLLLLHHPWDSMVHYTLARELNHSLVLEHSSSTNGGGGGGGDGHISSLVMVDVSDRQQSRLLDQLENRSTPQILLSEPFVSSGLGSVSHRIVASYDAGPFTPQHVLLWANRVARQHLREQGPMSVVDLEVQKVHYGVDNALEMHPMSGSASPSSISHMQDRLKEAIDDNGDGEPFLCVIVAMMGEDDLVHEGEWQQWWQQRAKEHALRQSTQSAVQFVMFHVKGSAQSISLRSALVPAANEVLINAINHVLSPGSGTAADSGNVESTVRGPDVRVLRRSLISKGYAAVMMDRERAMWHLYEEHTIPVSDQEQEEMWGDEDEPDDVPPLPQIPQSDELINWIDGIVSMPLVIDLSTWNVQDVVARAMPVAVLFAPLSSDSAQSDSYRDTWTAVARRTSRNSYNGEEILFAIVDSVRFSAVRDSLVPYRHDSDKSTVHVAVIDAQNARHYVCDDSVGCVDRKSGQLAPDACMNFIRMVLSGDMVPTKRSRQELATEKQQNSLQHGRTYVHSFSHDDLVERLQTQRPGMTHIVLFYTKLCVHSSIARRVFEHCAQLLQNSLSAQRSQQHMSTGTAMSSTVSPSFYDAVKDGDGSFLSIGQLDAEDNDVPDMVAAKVNVSTVPRIVAFKQTADGDMVTDVYSGTHASVEQMTSWLWSALST